ncbi:MAG TPA: ABC transporter permease [Terriglobia bacterium]|nr:ABC transporter permease [Terriglobia bacterium]
MQAYRQNVGENLLLALDTLRSHKVRSFLTVLGVLIGTTTVIAVASLVSGLSTQMADVAKSFGTRTIFVYKFEPGIHFRLTREERLRKPLTFDDAMAIRDQCPDVEDVAVELVNWNSTPPVIKYKGADMLNGNFTGATAEDFRISNATLAEGRFYTEFENQHRRFVTVIGADVVTRFFPHEDPVGKNIVVGGNTFQIIGTLSKRKEFLGDTGNDRVVYIPYLTYKQIYPAVKDNFIMAMAYPGRMSQAEDEITGLLRRRRSVKPWQADSFGLATAESIITQFRQIIATTALAMVVLSSIGLLVGGIGVMNIMLVSVTERTREIGVRKAIGARRSDITWQFLLEAMTLTGAGGILGILLGCSISFLVKALVPQFPTSVPIWSVFTGFIVAVGVGLFFGIWPAMKASKLDPIVALRYE